ncbi:MAG: transporter substrate-binding domain-containing protein, partial [Rubrivivax sp.]
MLRGWLIGVVLAGLALAAQALELSAAERAWISGHGPVRVMVVKGIEPFYRVGDDGSAPQGFAIDLLALAAERAGLTLRYQAVDSTAAAVKAFIDGQADMSPIAAPSVARQRHASFPGSLLQVQLVLVARRDTPDLSSAQNFAGRTLGTVEASAPAELIASAFPEARILPFRNSQEMVLAVSRGQADLGVAWQHDAVYAIEAGLLSNLQVHRLRSVESRYYGPVVSRQQPLLHSILEKALASLTPAERAAAARRWLPAGSSTLWAP